MYSNGFVFDVLRISNKSRPTFIVHLSFAALVYRQGMPRRNTVPQWRANQYVRLLEIPCETNFLCGTALSRAYMLPLRSTTQISAKQISLHLIIIQSGLRTKAAMMLSSKQVSSKCFYVQISILFVISTQSRKPLSLITIAQSICMLS